MKALDRTLAAWAKEYRETLDPSIVKLIEGAKQDLHFGPAYGEESDFPGFETATCKIREALEDMPSVLYVDTGAECWSESESGPDECGNCYAQGTVADEDSEDESAKVECPCCNGTGKTEPFLEETYQVERHDLIGALVGRDLAGYL
jgi:hypothetical protein